MTTTVIGKDSFLAKALQQHITNISSPDAYNFLDHQEALENLNWIRSTNILINFSFSPQMHKDGYKEDEDIDSKLAKHIQKYPDISYVMISSRKVYGETSAKTPTVEETELNPDTPYGHAKKEIEKCLRDILDTDRLTILRPANIFGSELGRKTFFGLALTNLRNNGIIAYDFDPQTKRDFVSDSYFANAVHAILQNLKPGIFNIGSGFSIECEKIALWLIEGFGSGQLDITQDVMRDSFELDMQKTYKTYDIEPYSQDSLRSDCLDAAQAIKD